jgi:hypothetical protein
MADILLNRCGASPEDWQALIDARYVATELELAQRHLLTAEGLREYRRQSKGKYF